MNDIIDNFQFIRPLWLWAVLALVLGYAAKLKFGSRQNVWQQLIPAHLYKQMIVRKGVVTSNKFIHVAALTMLMAIVAAAGPSWEKLPQAVYQTQAGKVILMDMSMSMRATDLSPNRLTRARFKALDLLDEIKEGETGLVAYAGDAFSVSPLTDDATNLASLLPVLTPEIMPIEGSVAINGLNAAASLLLDAGYQQGQIYWITDGIRYDEIKEIRNFLSDSPFDVSALLVGTQAGAPIAMLDGQLLKDFTGKIVVPSINSRYMNQAMSGTGAQFHIFANDNSDIQAMKRTVDFKAQQQSKEVENTTGDALKDMGPYLLLLLLPVAAYSFRKGVLSAVVVTSFMLLPTLSSNHAYAYQLALNDSATAENAPQQNSASKGEQGASAILNQLFKNADQRGKLAFDAQDYQTAAQVFEDAQWQAASAYKSGDFERAEALYSALSKQPSQLDKDLNSHMYNMGNSLAKQGKLEAALAAYNKVLAKNSAHTQATANKAIVEQLLEQQENEQQEQENSENSEQNQDENTQESDEDSGESESDSSQDSEKEGESQEDSTQQDAQDSEQQDSQSSDSSEKSDEALQQEAQNQSEQNAENDEQPEQQAQDASQQKEDDPQEGQEEQAQTAAISNQMNMDDLTPQEKEELKRMQMILNKIPDDPAYLLKRKMQLEAYKRQNNPSPPEQENW